jgi:hypothetical protein
MTGVDRINIMKCLKVAGAVLAILGAAQAAAVAAPVQVDFNVAGFGPAPNASHTFTKNDVVGDVDFTFQSLNASGQSDFNLYWDANDGGGHADGFGVMGGNNATTYSADEIEGDERLALRFSRAVNLLGFNLTDFFYESEPNLQNCTAAIAECYIERGYFQLEFAGGGTSSWLEFNAFASSTRDTNGTFDIAMDFQNVVGLLFRAPGATPDVFARSGFKKLEDFSLAGVRIDTPPVPAPEPGTMALLGLGLSGLAAARRRRKS